MTNLAQPKIKTIFSQDSIAFKLILSSGGGKIDFYFIAREQICAKY